METEAKANSCRCFLGENGRPLRVCSRRIDKGGPGQYYSIVTARVCLNNCRNFDKEISESLS